MAMMRPMRHIIESFFNAMSLTFAVNSFSNSGISPNNVTSIVIDNILNLRAGLTVNIDGTDYTILSVSGSTIFTVAGTLTNPQVVILPRPVWFAGSPIAVNNVISDIPVPQYKVPMVWLYEVIRENRHQNPDDMIERDAAVRIFFLDEADFSAWDKSTNQADYYTKVIDGMDRLAEYFKDKMYDSMYFGKFENYTITAFAKFGTYTDGKGVLNSVLNENLSGVELSLTLPVNKILNGC
jgi:hypothetical protein